MNRLKGMNRKALARIGAACALILGISSAGAPAFGAGTVTMTVTAVAKKEANPPALSKQDVQLYLNKERTQVANWRRGEKLYLAVLIDDSLDPTVASQWRDVQEFINAQPETTYIAVAYARNGRNRR